MENDSFFCRRQRMATKVATIQLANHVCATFDNFSHRICSKIRENCHMNLTRCHNIFQSSSYEHCAMFTYKLPCNWNCFFIQAHFHFLLPSSLFFAFSRLFLLTQQHRFVLASLHSITMNASDKKAPRALLFLFPLISFG